MLYTGKGDDGKTSLFGGCDGRISKSSVITEALGAVDEVNSLLGVIKVGAREDRKLATILDQVQQDLFIVQAELAGAEKNVSEEKVAALEKIISEVEQELPPITTFLVSGGTVLSAQLDYARAMARRVERRVVRVSEERGETLGTDSQGLTLIDASTLAYLNRLSSLLYALARLTNHKSGIKEEPPRYE